MADNARSSTEIVPIVAIMPEPPASPGAGAIGIKRDGSFVMLIRVFPVDFDMRTAPEQESILLDYADLIDSLTTDFPIQIYCHNKKLNAEMFFRQFEGRLSNQMTSPLIKELIQDHIHNFDQQIRHNTMVQKEFYIILPYKPRTSAILERPSDQLPLGTLFRLLGENAKRKSISDPDPEDVEMARVELDTRCSQVQYYLDRIGCENYRLSEEEIRRLFYEILHPGLAEHQKPISPSRGRVFGPTGQEISSVRRRRTQEQGIEDLRKERLQQNAPWQANNPGGSEPKELPPRRKRPEGGELPPGF